MTRRSRGATLARALGALGMLGLTVVLFWLLSDPTFRITEASVTFDGLVNADEAAVRAHLDGIDRQPNVFRVRAADLVRDISTLPDVDAATASVTLPAGISIRLEERVPLFVWDGGDEAWLVDEEGMLFGPTHDVRVATTSATDDTETTATPDAGTTATATPGLGSATGDAVSPSNAGDVDRTGLPVVSDARLPVEAPTIGGHLPMADVEVMRRLLAVTPELLGSKAAELRLRVDQNLGYELRSDRGWVAVFGRYTPLVQPPGVIPRQVQCLQALLAREDERKLGRIILSVADDACGTYTKFG